MESLKTAKSSFTPFLNTRYFSRTLVSDLIESQPPFFVLFVVMYIDNMKPRVRKLASALLVTGNIRDYTPLCLLRKPLQHYQPSAGGICPVKQL